MPNVLVIDYDEELVDRLSAALVSVGYGVATASNSYSAKKRIAEIGPNLVISEFFMPGLGGVELFYVLRENPKCRDTPFILMSSFLPSHSVLLRIGASAVIKKPFMVQEVVKMVSTILNPR